jgi:CRP/FNR family cyclic AMP-dependent transcriptional regulator
MSSRRYSSFEDASPHDVLADGYGGLNASQTRIRVSQDSLASMVSLSRQTTNQWLRSLESQRIVSLKSGEIAILDFDWLRAASLGEAEVSR